MIWRSGGHCQSAAGGDGDRLWEGQRNPEPKARKQEGPALRPIGACRRIGDESSFHAWRRSQLGPRSTWVVGVGKWNSLLLPVLQNLHALVMLVCVVRLLTPGRWNLP